MTYTPTDAAETFTGASLVTTTFPTTRGLSRAGYDPHEVDTFLVRTAAAVDKLISRLNAAERDLGDAQAEIARLRDRIDRDSRTAEVQQAVTVLTSAQITADATVAHADEYSARVMTEAQELYEETRRNAAILEQETQDKAKAVYEDAVLRVEAIEREKEERLAQLTLATAVAQQEIDGQTAYLRTLRDATRTQLEVFLVGLLDHLAEEYGRAHPAAANAANELVAATSNGSKSSAARRAERTQLPGTAVQRPHRDVTHRSYRGGSGDRPDTDPPQAAAVAVILGGSTAG
jgi:hypothetical protein